MSSHLRLTFSFARYNPERTFSIRNCAVNAFTNEFFHVEVYDRVYEVAYYVTTTSRVVRATTNFYSPDYGEHITVVITRQQHDAVEKFIATKINMGQRFSDMALLCFPFAAFCNYPGDDTITCSQMTAELIAHVWEIDLPRPARQYSPADVYNLVETLCDDGVMTKSTLQNNPSPEVDNIQGEDSDGDDDEEEAGDADKNDAEDRREEWRREIRSIQIANAVVETVGAIIHSQTS